MNVSTVTAWFAAHPYEGSVLLYVALSVVIGALPQRAQSWPVVGFVVRFAAALSALTHSDAAGTLTWPMVGRAAREAVFGRPAPSTIPPTQIDSGCATVPVMAALLTLAVLAALGAVMVGCPSLPPPDGCTPHAWRCGPDGRPAVCSSSQRWTPVGDVACAEVGATCCEVQSYGRLVAACVAAEHCLTHPGIGGDDAAVPVAATDGGAE